MIHKDQFASFVDLWVNTSLAIKQDKEADKEFGWVQEMYAYSIASATAAGGPIRHQLKTQFMAQPPWDDRPTREVGMDRVLGGVGAGSGSFTHSQWYSRQHCHYALQGGVGC